jgi:hypothetical protein
MRKTLIVVSLSLAAALLVAVGSAGGGDKAKGKQTKRPLVHAVYFYLKEDAPSDATDKLIDDAHEFLKKIATVRSFWVGRPLPKSKSQAVISDYQVGLLITFDDRAGFETYADHPLHLKFVERHKKNFKSVSVYDFIHQEQKKTAPGKGPKKDTRAPGEIELFNGKDLTGWVAEGKTEYTDGAETKPAWAVRGGLLVTAGKGFGFLRYAEKQFGDFALHVEYRLSPRGPKGERANSGVGIRTIPFDPKNTKTRASVAAYEVQLYDNKDRPPTKNSTGALYGHVAPSTDATRPAGEWNSLDVECVGPRVAVTINGVKVVDVDQSTIDKLKDKPLRGYISLQSHSRQVEFRNVRVREIGPAAN